MKSKKYIKSALVLGMMLGGIAQNCAFAEAVFNKKNADVYLGLLYLQPHAGNLNYAVFVSALLSKLALPSIKTRLLTGF